MRTVSAAPAIIMTGASAGIGHAAALALLGAPQPPARLIVGARDPESARRWLAPRAATAGVPLEVLRVDLASLASTRDFADAALAALGPAAGSTPVVYIGNAGGQAARALRRSLDGHEETFAVNTLAHIAVVWRLWPALVDGGRIILTASGTHDPTDRGARRFGFRGGRYSSALALARAEVEPGTTDAQAARDRYATSKLAVLLFVQELARRAPSLHAWGYDPGLVPGTGLARHRSRAEWIVWKHLLPIAARVMPGASTIERSGATLAHAAVAGAWPNGGQFNFTGRAEPMWEDAHRSDWAADLWDGAATLLRVHGIHPPQ
jgi:protochlorophyllide reductase